MKAVRKVFMFLARARGPAPGDLGKPWTVHRRGSWSYLLLFCFGAVAVAGLFRHHVRNSHQQTLACWGARQSSVADDRTRRVTSWLNERQADAKLLSANPAVITSLSPQPDSARAPSELPRLERGDCAYEYCFQHKDRTYRWMRDKMRLMKDEGGNPVEIVGCWIDITERKRAVDEMAQKVKEVEKLAKVMEGVRTGSLS